MGRLTAPAPRLKAPAPRLAAPPKESRYLLPHAGVAGFDSEAHQDARS